MQTALEALNRLREGNRRFAANKFADHAVQSSREQSVAGQKPFAIILGCSDSRVPAELIFDQGLGDLFVIRVAGNIVAPSQVGSVEFAAAEFGTRLVVVLGHSQCGAIRATIDELTQNSANRSPNLRSIVDRIRPAVEPLIGAQTPARTLMEQAVRANVLASADHLRHGSDIIEGLIRNDNLMVVGAEYALETGKVDFFDGLVPG
ncbi:MAG: carbonic anhydrase [bacterium]